MQQEIGLGSAESIEEVTIVWPGSGTEQHFERVEPRRFYSVVEGESDLRPVKLPLLDLWLSH